MTTARLTSAISDDFLRDVSAMAARFRAQGALVDGLDWLRVWNSESGVNAHQPTHAIDPKTGKGHPFGGLNQMGSEERRSVGFSGSFEDWLALSNEEQLPYVERWYQAKNAARFMTDAAALYLINFAPAFVSHANDPDFVIFREPSEAYRANRSLDHTGDGAIRVRDMALFLQSSNRGPRWDEIASRYESVAGSSSPSVSKNPSASSPSSISSGVQISLASLALAAAGVAAVVLGGQAIASGSPARFLSRSLRRT